MPRKIAELFVGEADARGAYGGRGSGKTRGFAAASAAKALILASEGRSGVILCGRQYQNSLADSSMAEVKRAIDDHEWMRPHFDIGDRFIRTSDGRIEFLFMGLERNLHSIKSTAGILICWVEEAEPVSEDAWTVLIPTMREAGSELWVTWNPARKGSATDKRFRKSNDPRYRFAEVNWRDNPMFPAVLERQRQRDLQERPEMYGHIWEGEYVSAATGAYFASGLAAAKLEGRIGVVPKDEYLPVQLFVDIGGTGARADSFVIWVIQFVGLRILVLDHYEVQSQTLQSHLSWLRERSYTPGQVSCVWLPHDGASFDKVFAASYETGFTAAGYFVEVVPNQGRGAAASRIEAVRRRLGACWFNEKTTEAGREALAWYHEKRDEIRSVGLGPEHDWASHSSDGFGLMAIVSESQLGKVAPGSRSKSSALRRRSSPMSV